MNKKSLIFSGVFTGLGVLTLILMASLPLFTDYTLLSYMSLALQAGDQYIMLGLPILLTLLMLLVSIIFGTMNILTSVNVIKSAKSTKAFAIVNVVMSSLLTFFAILTVLIFVAFTQGFVALAIMPVIFGIAMIVMASINLHYIKKNAIEQ